MSRSRRRAVVLAAFVIGALAIVLVPGIVAKVAARKATQALGVAVGVGWLSWNPFTGWWAIDGIRVGAERGPSAVRAESVRVRIYLRDLVRGRRRVRDVELSGARLRLHAAANGWELPLPPRAPRREATSAELPTIVVDHARARRTVVMLEPDPKHRSALRLRRLVLTAAVEPAGTWIAGTTLGRLDRGPVRVSARVRTGERHQRIRVDVGTRNLDVTRTIHLVAPGGPRELRGLLDVHARYDDALHGRHRHQRLRGRLAGRDLAVGAHGRDGVRASTVSIPRVAVDLVRRHASAAAMRVRGAALAVERGDAGIAVPGVLRPDAPSGAASPGWTYDAAGVTVDDGRVEYVDARTPDTPVTLLVKRAELGRVGEPSAPVAFSLEGTLEAGGRVGIHGDVVREPLAVTAHADAEAVTLPKLLALAPAPVAFESATASAHVDVTRSATGVEATGTVEVTDAKTISPDPARPENVMAWKTVQVAVRRARTNPPSIELDRVHVAWPYVLVDRTPQSIFPLSLVLPPPAPPAGTAEVAAPAAFIQAPVAITVGQLTVEGGRIDFRDASLQPPYWRSLAELAVDARGIAVPATRVRDIAANGLVDEISPLHLEGTVGTKTDLRVKVDQVALPPFNAYLAPVSSYAVSSGIVSADTEVVLDRSQLEVSNRIVLSRFGIRGGSEDDFVERELGIPLTLALALMKDYRGDISLTLPFGGDLMAPTFSMRSVAVQALLKAIRGAVLSPLNALGRVFFSDDRIEGFELTGVPFAPGARTLDPAAHERMTQIARVVSMHPELALRVRGSAAPADVEHLQDAAALAVLAERSRAEPERAFVRARLAGAPPPPLDAERRRRLDTLIASLPWPADALQALAVDRGAAAAAGFVTDFGVDARRVQAVAPAPTAPGDLAPRPEASIGLSAD